MAKVLSKQARVMIGSNLVGRLTKFDEDLSDEVLDTTANDSTTREYTPMAMPESKISFEAQFDIADVGQDAARAAILAGTEISVSIFPEGNSSGKPKFTGNMFLETLKRVGIAQGQLITTGGSMKGAPLAEGTVA